MIEYEDKKAFDLYHIDLIKSIENNTYTSFMRTNNYPLIYIKERRIPDFPQYYSTHYLELPIEKITGCNVSNVRKEIIDPNNWGRVIDSIKHILENKCRPIEVINDGDDYYIHDGKHRFYAHLLLRKDNIPVSLYKKSETEIQNGGDSKIVFEESNSPFRDPEEALYFFEQYKESFGEVMEAIMKGDQETLHYILKLRNFKGQVMVFSNTCTSGNSWRSSEITCKILQRSGFNVDGEYIKEHTSFHLYDRRDAHHINFNYNLMDYKNILDLFMSDVIKVESYSKHETELFKLHDYVCRNPHNKTCKTHFSHYSSFICHGNEYNYFIVGTETIETNKDTIYIFKDKSLPFNSLTVELIGRLPQDDTGYNIILENLRMRCQ